MCPVIELVFGKSKGFFINPCYNHFTTTCSPTHFHTIVLGNPLKTGNEIPSALNLLAKK